MRSSNYNKRPIVPVPGEYARECWCGWEAIGNLLTREIAHLISQNCSSPLLAVECYSGVFDDNIRSQLEVLLRPSLIIDAKQFFHPPAKINRLAAPFLGGDDPIFGFMSSLEMGDFLDMSRSEEISTLLRENPKGLVLVVGPGASLIAPSPNILVYADMPRWEGQLRQRRNEVSNLGVENSDLNPPLKYKRSFFIDWRVCDRLKQRTMKRWNFLLDTTDDTSPKIITGRAHLATLEATAHQPFRVVPFFDPGPWGGQWMKEVCDLDRTAPNYAWCFDCVPEENSLLLGFLDASVEIPAINLVMHQPKALLGDHIFDRFGAEFPIRFDFLDTMGGGNLSLQVHPTSQYMLTHFGLKYTQDESYYLLDAGSQATVLLGHKNDASLDTMMEALRSAHNGKASFPDHEFAARWPAKRHDHFLIPAGTLHCSGADCMVLEISATPYIFTFKLWDWERVGLDGKPRTINLKRGASVIDWSWDANKVKEQLINPVEEIAQGDGWREERTGLHKSQFIETRRHWFTGSVPHHTRGTLNVLNLVEGEEVLVESPDGAFAPYMVHYAETFIVPASVGPYTIRPLQNILHSTLKAYVRA